MDESSSVQSGSGSGSRSGSAALEGDRRTAVVVEWRALTAEELDEALAGKVRKVTQVFALPRLVALRVLQRYRYETDRVVEALVSRPEAVAASVGLTSLDELQGAGPGSETGPADGDVVCGVCYCEVAMNESHTLRCGHRFCYACWRIHVEMEVREGRAAGLACMGSDAVSNARCSVGVDDFVVERFVLGKARVAGRYKRFLRESYVSGNPYIKWCPFEGCECAVEVDLHDAAVSVECHAGHLWCYRCSHEAHVPASCEQVKTWLTEVREESANDNWIVVNTKACPKCGVATEKNGGCNRIGCAKCSIHWCWLCGISSPTPELIYSHGCGKFEEEQSETIQTRKTAAAEMARFTHYADRYNNHHVSREFAQKLAASLGNMITSSSSSTTGGGSSEMRRTMAEQLAGAAKAHLRARTALKWSYVFGFYCRRGTRQLELFEFTQEALAKEVEQLASALEDDEDNVEPADVVRLAHLVEHRLDGMQRTVAEGMQMAAESGGVQESSEAGPRKRRRL
ncbi:ariadne-1 [Thecamonas trahens ATCC 50062]|uniref:RBR-type E3 ubiquitin transferase n=1 Tax=Thecamonas trahens ATCC 50062 TaxID=461836 RepID=A0A0L0D9G7_THETB|nr:ariadne-1 [Thecamonas trahens ATCC 50062]KNC48885.1 ariadne-1 [Thecamonas trahens ATCC 50062]|eukprot:XP_013758305.1 ariadne-1 [Thecamonas trahens ATCC 50062]